MFRVRAMLYPTSQFFVVAPSNFETSLTEDTQPPVVFIAIFVEVEHLNTCFMASNSDVKKSVD